MHLKRHLKRHTLKVEHCKSLPSRQRRHQSAAGCMLLGCAGTMGLSTTFTSCSGAGDYGDPTTAEGFGWVLPFSPVHNVATPQTGQFPSFLITTAVRKMPTLAPFVPPAGLEPHACWLMRNCLYVCSSSRNPACMAWQCRTMTIAW